MIRRLHKKIKNPALWIAALYALFGIGWVILSDYLVLRIFPWEDAGTTMLIQNVKGAFFALLSSVVLYLIISYFFKTVKAQAVEYEQFFDSLPVMVLIANHQGKITMVNKTFELLSGWSLKHFTSEDDFLNDFLYASDGAFPMSAESEQLGSEWRDFQVKTKNNSQLTTCWTCVWLNKSMKVYIGQDISYRRVAEKALLKSYWELANFKKALKNSALVSVTDRQGSVIEVNPAFCNASGYPKNELIGKKYQEVNATCFSDGDWNTIWNTVRSGKPWRGEIRNTTKSGKIYWLDTTINPITDDKGSIYQFLSVQFPISDRKKYEEEREMLIKRLIQNNRDLEEFGFIISHNLRAPVAQILGLINLYQNNNIEQKEIAEITSHLRSSAKNLDAVIKDLNKVLEVRKGFDIVKAVDLQQVARSAVNALDEPIRKAGIEIHLNFQEVRVIHSIPGYIYNIIYSLLSNAIKYRSDQRPQKIEIACKKKGKSICLSVSDSGLGIDLNLFKDKLFQMYQRFHLHVEGKGLGLFLVKNQVDALGGKIEVHSHVNEGTTFEVYLPLLQKAALMT
ncbi:PAS domain S-box protein [Rapidithrix thailandica]|uniref:histidine kinase n=1 Tax=Rapidithrix thailandica TaxID=413964 RepID=A0AAW9SA66_9BACT